MAQWTKLFERDYSIQYWEIATHIMCGLEREFDIGHVEEAAVYHYADKHTGIFIRKEDLKKHNREVQEFYSDLENAKRFYEFFNETGKLYLAAAKKAEKIGAQSNDSKKLLIAYKQYVKKLIEYSSAIWYSFYLNDIMAEKLAKFLEKRYNEVKPNIPLTDIMAESLKPAKISKVIQANLDAAKIKINFSQATLEEFRKKYEWLPCVDVKFEPLSIEEANKMVQSAAAYSSQKQLDLTKILKLSKEEKAFLDIAKLYFYVKDLRDEYRRMSVYRVLPLYKAIARQLKISFSQMYSMMTSEVIAALEGKNAPDVNELNNRLNEAFLIYKRGNIKTCVTGKDAVKKANELAIIIETQATNIQKFSGLAASPGIVKGKVTLVHDASELKKVSKGCVLVAITTNPNYTTAMNVASAIVTDEGGITSHAAIVSRELKKPCIVGTKIATKVLKDGDVIEVNGETGEVRKIE